MKKNEMAGVCGTYKGGEKYIRFFLGKPEGKGHLENLSTEGRIVNIKTDLRRIGWEGV
jgi:hypothetical protein